MSGNFTACAQRLAGQSAWLLGWRPAEFWAATPAELACCLTAIGDQGGHGAPLTRAQLQQMEQEHG